MRKPAQFGEKGIGRVEVLRTVVGVVVVDFVIVPDHQPRAGGVRSLQLRIHLVLRVAIAVIRQRVRFGAVVVAYRALAPGTFVDVVADVHHKIQFLRRHVTIGGVKAVFVVLARRHGKADLATSDIRGRCGARAANGADRIAGHEAVPVPVRRREASRLHVYGMCELRRSERFAAADNLAKTRIDGDFPAYGNRRVRHASAIERIRCEPRP